MDEQLDVLVFGAGALGSLVGGLLARQHAVRLVGREPHVSAVRECGLRVTGQLDADVEPRATTTVGEWEGDLAVVTVKAADLPAAADALADRTCAVCPLTNGLPEYDLRERLGGRVIGGTATYGARLVEPGVVRCTGEGTVHLGELDGSRGAKGDTESAADTASSADTKSAADTGTSDDADSTRPKTSSDAVSDRTARFAAAARAAQIDCTAEPTIDGRLWEKLAVNAGINPVTALVRADNAAVTGGPAGSVARRAARETARVAVAAGIDTTERRVVEQLSAVAETTAANRSSMASDVAAGRPTEIGAISGTVVEYGEQFGVATPTNRTLAELVRAWEAEHTE